MVTFTPLLLYPGERDSGTHSIAASLRPRAGLDCMDKRKFFNLLGLELPPLGSPVRSQSLYRLGYRGSYPDEAIGFFIYLPSPSSRTMALGLTQALTEIFFITLSISNQNHSDSIS
jgi:hypothetical protein